ncbi:MAG: Glutaconate CoA-transferase subunit [Acidimicrobiaceae bacterium]|nr:Glutaconate CoA-transferase subunit [Acidimicrobiaceae bacterium]
MTAAVGGVSRIVGLDELVGVVRSGDRIGVGGALLTRLPLGALHALARSGTKNLTYASWGGGIPLEILLGAGAVDRIVFCFSSLDIFGLAPLFRRALEEKSVEVEELPAYAFTARLEAAMQNVPFMPFRLPGGSDVFWTDAFETHLDDATGERDIGFAERLDLDCFLMHAQRADEAGNLEISGARGMDTTAAFAARKVLATVEEVVPVGSLGLLRHSFVIPRHFVEAIAVVPHGAYPTSCLPCYTADFAALADLTASSPPRELPLPAPAVLHRLGEAATLGVDRVRAVVRETAATLDEAVVVPETASIDELMVCWLARQFDDESICSAGAVSPLAVTAYLLAKAMHAPNLTIFMTSGGLLDVALRPMLLSLGEALDTTSAAVQCGGEDSYRWYYQQGRVSYEVVTSAQIDRRARTNNISVTSPSGRTVRLPGQGGMADVADLHQNFLLYLTRQSSLSLVDSVEHVSASRSLHDPDARRRAGLRPGSVGLITNLGVFGFDAARGELVLETLHPGVTLDEMGGAMGFEPLLADGLGETEMPSPEMLACLRDEIDPIGIRRLEFAPAKDRSALLSACIESERELVERALRL